MDPDTITLLPVIADGEAVNQIIEKKHVFDGLSTAVEVPPESVDKIIPLKFSLTFSMKHARGSKDDEANKQTVLCESDETGMNGFMR